MDLKEFFDAKVNKHPDLVAFYEAYRRSGC